MLLRPAALVSTLMLCLTMSVLPVLASTPSAAAASPQAPQRPVPNADSYTVLSSGGYALPVLENDETSLLSNGELTLCGVTVDEATQDLLYAEIDRDDPDRVYVETSRTAYGRVTFTYDACQGDRRATTTVTVTITRLLPPVVTKKKNRRAKVLVENPNADVALRFRWGSPRTSDADGERGIGAGRRRTIAVARTRIYWVAYVRDQGSVVVAGDGTVAKIKKKR